MTEQSAVPPPMAEWLLGLVAEPQQTATILGDLLEEFSAIAARSGSASARRWYWRQTRRTIAHLIASQVRHGPRETVAFAIGGFAFYILAERAVHVSAEAVGSHTRAYFYPSAVPYWRAVTAVECYVVPVMIGWLIARAARGREIMAAVVVGSAVTTWLLAFYTSWVLTSPGALILVPDFSMTPMLYDVHSGAPPHGPSLSNTLTHLWLTMIYWWIPTVVMLAVGAMMRRGFAMRQTISKPDRLASPPGSQSIPD